MSLSTANADAPGAHGKPPDRVGLRPQPLAQRLVLVSNGRPEHRIKVDPDEAARPRQAELLIRKGSRMVGQRAAG